MPHAFLTEPEYWNEIQLVSTEIEDAIAIFHTYEEINRLALSDTEVLRVLDQDALFWKVKMYALETSLFIILGRIFDADPDVHSIHKVLAAALRHVQFFSKEALAARKMGAGTKPDWLDGYMATAWAPADTSDLRHSKRGLAIRNRQFEDVYRPIRHSIFAHRLMSNDQAAFELFGNTSRAEVSAILDFLHDLIDIIIDLYSNGIKPELGLRDFTEYNQCIRRGPEGVLRRLVGSSCP
jgi:hypothetical protein